MWWKALALGFQLLDMTTTAVRLHQGCVETVWPNQAAMYVGKSASITVMFVLDAKHHQTAAKIVAGSDIAQGAYGAIRNLRTTCR